MSNRNLNSIKMLSILSIFLIATIAIGISGDVVNAKEVNQTKEVKKATPQIIEKVRKEFEQKYRPKIEIVKTVEINNAVAISTEQLQYADIWTFADYNGQIIDENSADILMTRYINLRYPSTLALTFSSELETNPYLYIDDVSGEEYVLAGFAYVVIYIDGNEIPYPIVYKSGQYDPDTGSIEYGDYSTSSYTFREPYISAGNHRIDVKARGSASFGYKSLTIAASGVGH